MVLELEARSQQLATHITWEQLLWYSLPFRVNSMLSRPENLILSVGSHSQRILVYGYLWPDKDMAVAYLAGQYSQAKGLSTECLVLL